MGNTMIGLLLVACSLAAHQLEVIIVRHYGKKQGKGGMFFNAIICLFAMLYFLVTDTGGLHFARGIWIYGIVNSLMYATGFYSAYVAFKIGSFGLTRLFTSFGIIISTFYGIIFLNEPTSALTYISLALILISLALMNYRKEDNDSQKISFKWVIYVLLIVLSNAAITIIGRMQYGIYGDTYKNEFLIISLAGAAISLFVLGAIFELDNLKVTIKHGFLYGALAGIFNGINNLLVLVTYNYLPISFTSPLKSGLGIVISFLLSALLYKEKFNRRQLASVFMGILAVVLMNIKM
ncbi:MAG: EamA family transporter [Clostridia bacterium]|nr:EamA family transporter [Clostridia bacterium]